MNKTLLKQLRSQRPKVVNTGLLLFAILSVLSLASSLLTQVYPNPDGYSVSYVTTCFFIFIGLLFSTGLYLGKRMYNLLLCVWAVSILPIILQASSITGSHPLLAYLVIIPSVLIVGVFFYCMNKVEVSIWMKNIIDLRKGLSPDLSHLKTNHPTPQNNEKLKMVFANRPKSIGLYVTASAVSFALFFLSHLFIGLFSSQNTLVLNTNSILPIVISGSIAVLTISWFLWSTYGGFRSIFNFWIFLCTIGFIFSTKNMLLNLSNLGGNSGELDLLIYIISITPYFIGLKLFFGGREKRWFQDCLDARSILSSRNS